MAKGCGWPRQRRFPGDFVELQAATGSLSTPLAALVPELAALSREVALLAAEHTGSAPSATLSEILRLGEGVERLKRCCAYTPPEIAEHVEPALRPATRADDKTSGKPKPKPESESESKTDPKPSRPHEATWTRRAVSDQRLATARRCGDAGAGGVCADHRHRGAGPACAGRSPARKERELHRLREEKDRIERRLRAWLRPAWSRSKAAR